MNVSLFDYRPNNLRQKTEDWLKLNPQAWELFKRFALEKMQQGKKFGIGALTERVRWECPINTEGDEFKVNNSYRSWIARRLLEEYPGMAKFIETRKVNY